MAATFRARYDQPVTLAELSTLEPELLVNEISRLENSVKHLERSNDELRRFIDDPSDDDDDDDETKQEFVDTIAENDETIAKQRERIEMIRIALEEQIGVPATNSHYSTAAADRQPLSRRTATHGPANEREDRDAEVTGIAPAVRRTPPTTSSDVGEAPARITRPQELNDVPDPGDDRPQDESDGMYL